MALARTIFNLRLLPKLTAGQAPSPVPRVSVIVPARNEERVIERTVRALLAQDYPALEVIIVDDRSTDMTPQLLESIHDSRLIVVHGDEKPAGWLGKPWALHQGSLRATGELLLFVDADVIYEQGAITAAVAHLQRRNAAMISLLPRFEMRGFWENAAMPQLAMTLFTYIPTWLGDRRQIGALAVGGGPGNLVYRREYDEAGGHVALRDAVVDDVSLARRLRKNGRRTETVRADDFVWLRMYHGAGEIIDGFTKNAFSVFGRNYVVAFATLAGTVIVHFLPYPFALFGNVYAIATVIVISLTRALLFRSLRYPMWSAILLHPFTTVIWFWIFLRSTWLTGVRRQLHWRGRTYDAAETRFGHER